MFRVNQQVKTIGLDMQCNKVVCNTRFVRYLADDEIKVYMGGRNGTTVLDCVIEDGGINIMVDSVTLFV